jgi:hypothetical protein
MLARRKRQPRDEEPLVPHGLVSQALDALPPALGKPLPVQSSSPAFALVKRTKPSPTRILHWPRIAPRLGESVAFASAFSKKLQQVREHLQIAARATRIRNFASRCTEQSREIAYAIPTALRRIGDSVQISTNAARVRNLISECAHHAVGRSRDWSAQTVLDFRRRMIASANRLKQVRAPVHLPKTPARLRIRLSGLPLQARIAFAHASSEWNLKRESFSRNSRLWTSLALSTLSAVLVMGILSTARHYAKASLPSNRVEKVTSTQNTDAFAPATAAHIAASAPKRPSGVLTPASRSRPRETKTNPTQVATRRGPAKNSP